MKRSFFLLLFLFLAIISTKGQTRAELEANRKKTLEEIQYLDNALIETAKKRSQGVNDLKLIANRIKLRENVIGDLRQEIDLINYRIELNQISIVMMEEDLVGLRIQYEASIKAAMCAMKGYHPAMFILSARDFNQGYKRMKYIQQTARHRRRQTEIISDLVSQIQISKGKLENDKKKLDELRGREENQKKELEREQKGKQNLINQLSGQEKKLKKEIEDKKRISSRIEAEIGRMLEEEKKRIAENPLTPEEKLVGDDFLSNKGKLPWPVERGVISSRFGKHQHPVWKNVVEDNIGIEITSTGNTPVRAVFKGEVVRVFGISGGNMAVIIKHGKYLSVYQDLVNIGVKPGDKIETKQKIGDLYIDVITGNKGTLKFMIFENALKQDPELWISKRQ